MKKCLLIISMMLPMIMWAESSTNGVCGEKMQYNFDKATNTLYLTGTGSMYDYKDKKTPWDTYKSRIQYIHAAEGIETIGQYAFMNCFHLKQVSFPSTLRMVDIESFAGCGKIERIELPDSLRYVQYGAFKDTWIKSIKLSCDLQYLGNDALNKTDTVYMNYHKFPTMSYPFKDGAQVYMQTDNILTVYFFRIFFANVKIHWIVDESDVTIPQRLYNACMLQEAIEYILNEEFPQSNYRNVRLFTRIMRRLGYEMEMLNLLEKMDYVPEIKYELGRYYTINKKTLQEERPALTDYYVSYYRKVYQAPTKVSTDVAEDWRDWEKINWKFIKRNDFKLNASHLKDDSPEDIYNACLYGMHKYQYASSLKDEYKLLMESYKRGYKPAAGLLAYYYIDKFTKNNKGLPPAKTAKLARKYADEGMRNGIPLAYLADAEIHMYMGEKDAFYSIMDTVRPMFEKVCVKNGWYQGQIAHFYSKYNRKFNRDSCLGAMAYWSNLAIQSGYYYVGDWLAPFYNGWGRVANKTIMANGRETSQIRYYECLELNHTDDEHRAWEQKQREYEEIQRQYREAIMASLDRCAQAMADVANSAAQIASAFSTSSTSSSSSSFSSSSSSYSTSSNNNGVQLQQDRQVYYKWEDTLRKMKNGLTPYDENVKRQAQSTMRSIRQKWESRGQSMYHSSLEDW